MVPSVIYLLLRKFLEAVIPIGLGACLCHSLNDLVSDYVLSLCRGQQGKDTWRPSWSCSVASMFLPGQRDNGRGRTLWQPFVFHENQHKGEV